jgi:hypothetical protein
MFAKDPQHTGQSDVTAQCLNTVAYTINLDESTGFKNVHYGSPLLTSGNILITGVRKTVEGFLDLRAFNNGALLWQTSSAYVYPPNFWVPTYQPVLVGASGSSQRVYYAEAGGTVAFR